MNTQKAIEIVQDGLMGYTFRITFNGKTGWYRQDGTLYTGERSVHPDTAEVMIADFQGRPAPYGNRHAKAEINKAEIQGTHSACSVL